MKWMVNRHGQVLTRRIPQYEIDEVRGERLLTGYIEEDFTGIVRNVKLDNQAVIAGLIETDSLVVFTDKGLNVGDEIIISGESYVVDRIDKLKVNKVIVKRKR